MKKKLESELNPRDRLNDEGRKDFPRSLKKKMQQRDTIRRYKYGAIEGQREVATELANDLDHSISNQQYRRMWLLALFSAIASIASAVAAIIAVCLSKK